MTRHKVTDQFGKVHTRNSAHNVYSHAVVAHYADRPDQGDWRGREAYSTASWASRLDLAQKEADRRRRLHPYLASIEIIEAERS